MTSTLVKTELQQMSKILSLVQALRHPLPTDVLHSAFCTLAEARGAMNSEGPDAHRQGPWCGCSRLIRRMPSPSCGSHSSTAPEEWALARHQSHSAGGPEVQVLPVPLPRRGLLALGRAVIAVTGPADQEHRACLLSAASRAAVKLRCVFRAEDLHS